MVRLRLVNRLMAEMADRAIRIGAGMMMRDAAQHHHEHQQREQRYGNGETPNCSAFMHVTKAGRTPSAHHIRRWLSGGNWLCREHQNSRGNALIRTGTGARWILQR